MKSSRRTNNLQNCELEYKETTTDKINSNQFSCVKCYKNFKLFEKECLSKCPENTLLNKLSNTCEKDKKVEESKCDNKFSFNDNCIDKCPQNYHADKISKKCLEKTLFSFHWIYPSKGKCENNCGLKYNIDCSCDSSCFSEANCCDDFEKYCPSANYDKCGSLCLDCSIKGFCYNCKDNSSLKDKKCVCNNGFEYDIIKDECKKKISKSSHSIKEKNKNFKNSTSDNIHLKTKEGKMIKDIIEDLNLLKLNSHLLKNNTSIETNSTSTNITINIIAFNNDPKIISNTHNIIDSYNTKSKTSTS